MEFRHEISLLLPVATARPDVSARLRLVRYALRRAAAGSQAGAMPAAAGVRRNAHELPIYLEELVTI
jgi:hypothetical protein